ncbi:hypothetical protein [Magnetovibrio sp.]|uniref:hypothetical protein n=1 Tax=Magnetovibrio sp. TaxID=2024836 RepID=UPI002F95F25C
MVEPLNKWDFATGADVRPGDISHRPRHTPTNDIPQDVPLKTRSTTDDSILMSPQALAAIENDPFFGLSNSEIKKLDAVFAQIDAIFETAGDQPLSSAQEKQLDALERKIESILGGEQIAADLFTLLSEEGGQKVDALFAQADQIFEAAGDAPLTLEQQIQIEDLDRQIQSIVQNDLGPEDPFAGLSAQSIQQLDRLFSDIDALLNQTAGQPLTFAQEKLLNALDRKVMDIFAAHEV